MRRTMVLLVCAVAIGVPAYAKCKPDPGPDKPVVCIDQNSVADPDRVKVYGGDDVQFHFVGGHKGRKLVFDPGLVHDVINVLVYTYATGDDVKVETEGKYQIVDKASGKTADPIIV